MTGKGLVEGLLWLDVQLQSPPVTSLDSALVNPSLILVTTTEKTKIKDAENMLVGIATFAAPLTGS